MSKQLCVSLFLTSSPLLCFVSVQRFSLRVSGRRDPIRWCSAATRRLQCLCWGLSRRLVRGGVSFTVAGLMTELEATCKLFMLQEIRKYTKTSADRYINGTLIQDDECRHVIVCEGICVCVYLQCLFGHSEFSFYNREQIGM